MWQLPAALRRIYRPIVEEPTQLPLAKILCLKTISAYDEDHTSLVHLPLIYRINLTEQNR